MDLLRVLVAILLPPLGVFLQVGIGKHFWINILLTILGYIPGIVPLSRNQVSVRGGLQMSGVVRQMSPSRAARPSASSFSRCASAERAATPWIAAGTSS